MQKQHKCGKEKKNAEIWMVENGQILIFSRDRKGMTNKVFCCDF